MKLRAILLALAAVFALQAADVTGKWSAEVPGRNGTRTETYDLKQDGTTVTGSVSGFQEPFTIEEGKMEGDTLSFKITLPFGDGIVIKYTGAVSDNEIKFKREREGGGGGFGGGGPQEFVAKKAS